MATLDVVPEISVVVPVYNEEAMLEESTRDLATSLAALTTAYEIVLAENGSTDRTLALAEDLARRMPGVRAIHVATPNYGAALRAGLLAARGRFVVCEEIDLCDADFHRRALELLRAGRADLVVGSKAMEGARDDRPWLRRFATRVYNRLLRHLFGFGGTDTHGLKAGVRARLRPVVEACRVEHDVFASELVIRAERMGLSVVEIPVDVHEKRAPSIHLLRRVPRVLRNLRALRAALADAPGGIGPEAEATKSATKSVEERS
ncbi:MAG: glycosyltransferase [Deltaproteobacteria bacterium]|nr:MAG: glycosyltransferase [Deltaproteobacteria bacterium]